MTDPSPTLPRWVRNALAVGALLLAFVSGAVLFGNPSADTPVAETADIIDWTCSMHPHVHQTEPGDCPICGMDLIPTSTGSAGSTDQVVLSDRARALAGIRTSPVSRQFDAAAEVRLLGRIEPAETTRRNVTTWIGGRIDRLRVNTTGEQIRRGQVIANLYSPDVYGAHQDLLAAMAQVERLSTSPPAAQQAAVRALEAARERIRLLGVPADEVERMASATEPTRSIAIRSPFSGTVIDRVATEGGYVETGSTLYQVADLSTLWVQLDAYEGDLATLSVGQTVTLTVEAFPGETFTGRVAFIEPTVDAERRTARVRVEVDNADARLSPGMFAEAIVSAIRPGGAPLTIPTTAPLFTGRRSVVYIEVATDDGVAYEPRTVRLGPRLGDSYPVVSGLSEGDRVVSRGAFALDADLQIRGGPSMMTEPDDTAPTPADPVVLTSAQRGTFAPVVQAYLEVQQALAEDDLTTSQSAAQRVVDAAATLTPPSPARAAWSPLAIALRSHGTHVQQATTLEAARAGFEPLSSAIEALLARVGNPLDQSLRVAFCPMANRNNGARWVQSGDVVDNAYFGASMRVCGDFVETVSPGTTLDIRAPHVQTPTNHAGHNH
jgi:Cu(I)/Ag(I) efflux system membrane fusion protein